MSGATVEKLGHALSCSAKKAALLLEACAETCASTHENNFKRTLLYLRSMRQAGIVQPVVCVLRTSFDETPMVCRVAFRSPAELNVEVAKMYVIESNWCVIVRTSLEDGVAGKLLALHGVFSPSVRVANGMNGESIAAVMENVMSSQVPKELLESVCPVTIDLAECDGAGANLRALRLLAARAPHHWRLQLRCLCHSIHSISEKVWRLAPRSLTGVTRCILTLQTTTNMSRLKSVLAAIIRRRCVRIQGPAALSQEAIAYRQAVLSTWAPPSDKGKKTSIFLTVSSLLLNGDWRRQDCLIHHCPDEGCCRSDQECCNKMCVHIPMLFDSLRATTSKGNWSEWSAPLSLLGYWTAVHGLLPCVFKAAFPSVAEEECRGLGVQTGNSTSASLGPLG